MDEAREKHLVEQVSTLRTMEEIKGFREQLQRQSEEPTSTLFKALLTQQDRINRK
jgi:hypothetical protein